jgi:hypothetical protein
MSFHWKLLLNTVVAAIGLVVATRHLGRRRAMAWAMIVSAGLITAPYYASWLLGRLGPGSKALLDLQVALMQLAFFLQSRPTS